MSKSLPSTILADGITPLFPPDADAPRFAPPAQPGELGTLGPYRVLKRLGKGGMGAVYLALDTELERHVALKVMLPRYAADPEAAGRFRREARAAAAVRHDNVVTVYQVGEHAGTPFLAMELLKGHPLDRYLDRRERLTVAQAARVGTEAALGLAAAHALGLVHRDIKPANLWLEVPNGRVKILDFGLAKPLNETRNGTELTGSGAVMGTPAYMSPEQARGQPMDARSDLFSLGIVLYELCAGVRPFDGPNPTAVGIAIATEEPVPLHSRNPDVPAAFASVIHQLMAKSAGDRPQTAAEVARLLRAIERAGRAEVAPAPVTQVVYVPIHVADEPPSADNELFAALRDSGDETHVVTSAQTLVRVRPRARFPWKAVAGSVLLAAALVAVGLFVAGRPAKPVSKDEPQAKSEPTLRPIPPPSADLTFARWVFERNGRVTIDAAEGEFAAEAKLPKSAFRVIGVRFPPERPLADADIDQLAPLRDLTGVYSTGKNELTAAGFAKLAALPQAAKFKALVLPAPNAGAGVAALAKCRGLEHLAVQTTPLAGRLGFVAELTELRDLTAWSCGLTDDDLAAVAKLKLHQVNLLGNPRLTARGLEHLANSADTLNLLYLQDTGVSGSAAQRIAKFPKLVTLLLAHLDWTDDDARQLAALTKLQTLNLAKNKPPLTDAGLIPVIAGNPNLTELHLTDAHVTDALLDALAGHKGLTQLDVKNTRVTIAGVKRFMAAHPKCAVEFDYFESADADRALVAWALSKGGWVRVHAVPGDTGTVYESAAPLPAGRPLWVSEIVLGKTHKLADADVARFAGCDALTKIDAHIAETDLTDAGFQALSELPQAARFKELQLPSPRATGAGVAHLGACAALEMLWVPGTPGAAAAVVDVLDKLPKLITLHLQRCGATDAHLAKLRGRKFAFLSVVANPLVTDAGLAYLAEMDTLHTLGLGATGVTDAGLVHLRGLKGLKFLHLRETQVTTPAAKELMAALPGCKVDFIYDPAADPDRRLAAAMFAKGASVRLRDGTMAQSADQLPNGVIEVVAVGGRSAKVVPTDADIDLLAAAPALTHSDWGPTAFTDAGLERWSRSPNAKRMIELHLNSEGVTDAGTAHLVKFESLTWLNLCARDVTGIGLRRLAALPHLVNLNLNGCTSLRDDHLKELAAFPKLTRVDLGCPDITDAGLAHLAACKHLKVVSLHGRHRVTDAGLDALRKALPGGSQVIWHGK